MRETAFLTRGLRITLTDERGEGQNEDFHYEGGIVDFVAHLNENKDALHSKTIYFEGETDDGPGRGRDAVEHLLPGVGLLVRQQHQHPRGRLAPLGLPLGADPHDLNAYAREKGLLKEKDPNLTGDDVREGLTAVISVKLHDPQFEGQTKTKLGNPPIEGLVKETVNRKLARVPRGEPGARRSGS